ncbi:BREX-1 system adenine-specific DNA-methyltransferase PglX [Aeromicrobium ponti]|uniref:site-specific DNA-methyltransferase (adenine-specific) n=1 Tax=Cytobacillus oceanisediminis TaxID=665099 RepID=A0A562JRC7_9BACI|nr:BREX-1 system adenine-specific DNA-methyltransferase PglX [Cytobacillus oceanisediminis]TWH85732.1 Eco57I restriction-modification methylase [Cytobacillus oceanisediminis]
MNKAELKKFAVEARRDLMAKVSLKAEQYGITKDSQDLKIEEKYGQLFINDNPFPIERKHAFHTLQQRLKTSGYDQLIEEVAYTWFNRIIAIRYMEVNNYLPDRVNVLSSSTGKNEPDILLQYETMNLDVDYQQINEWLKKGENEKAYRKLFVAQCNSLNKLLPFLFEKIDDFTELLLPDYLLDQESIIRKIVNDLSDENFFHLDEYGSRSDNVEVLGWLYQYYMSEKKEQVGGLRNNAVKKEDLPVVTQLFTPKWIVQYMVQNSLGKLYDEKYEDNQLAQHWEYYLKHEENHHLYPRFESLEDLKIIDPACGSGHILIYAFEMLYDMYEEAGYPSKEIPQLILENNLYGLDIDKRAQQIANFALLMKAAEKQPRFISRLGRKGQSPKLNVFQIVDAYQPLSEEAINYFADSDTEKSLIKELLNQFENGKQFGSLIDPIEIPYREWINRLYQLENKNSDLIDESFYKELQTKLLPVLKQGLLLKQKYDVVVTNPPYHNKYNPLLKKFMNQNYKNYKSDLYSAFIYRAIQMSKKNGYAALMTPLTWMFITTHYLLRKFIIENNSISSLIQLEYSAFKEATVPICSFVIKHDSPNILGEFIDLSGFNGEAIQPLKVRESVNNPNVNYRYTINSLVFNDIPTSPIAYWVSQNVHQIFASANRLGEIADVKVGLQTGDNDKFLKLWHEVSSQNLDKQCFSLEDLNHNKKKWIICTKGGSYRKWYGNQEFVINYEKQGEEIKLHKSSVIRNENYYFKEGLTFSNVSTGKFSLRLHPRNAIFDQSGPLIYFRGSKDYQEYVFALLNSKVVDVFAKILSPTLHYNVGELINYPILTDENLFSSVNNITNKNILISKKDWDSFETSWDFRKMPFLEYTNVTNKLEEAFKEWKNETISQFNILKENEEQLNEKFIKLYGFQEILTPEVLDKDVTVRVADVERDSRSFLSYFIGCVMGRYSLDFVGLAYAGGEFDESKYNTFKPNKDGLIQLTDAHYFDNDIIIRLREFLSVAFSPDTIDDNIKWLAESLNMKKNESPEERLRRYFLDEFFNDHCKTYQKRPIYWLVESGKQKGLRTLIYMHRYQPDTMATIRFEHLQEIQSKYQNEIDMSDKRLANPSLSASDKRSLEKSKSAYQKKIEELQEFDKKLATYANEQIDIDLDDGVKVNYAQFENVLAKIK